MRILTTCLRCMGSRPETFTRSARNSIFSLIGLICLLAYGDCKAQMVIDLTTGTSPVGSSDNIWTAVQAPNSTVSTPIVSNNQLWGGTSAFAPYATNPCGRWISPYTLTGGGASFGCIPNIGQVGNYQYTMTFMNNNACPVTQATLNLLRYGGDNNLTTITVNGTPYAVPANGFSPLAGPTVIPVMGIVFGLNTITVTLNNAFGYTGFFLCGNLTIDFADIWNNTTSNSMGGDVGHDILVDQNGDVYVAGTYSVSTDFTAPGCPPLTLPGSTNPSAYIAKYSRCGSLLWVNYDNGSGLTYGTSLAYDSVRNLVYLTGTEDRVNVSFQTTPATPCGPPPVAAAPSIPWHFYVAKFNATTGSFIDIHHQAISNALLIHHEGAHIDVNNTSSTSTDIYLTATFRSNIIPDDVILVTKIQETSGTYTSAWINQTVLSTSVLETKRAVDLVHDPVNDLVYITGHFFNNISFPSAPMLSTPAGMEAFVWEFTGSTGTPTVGRQLGITWSVASGSCLVEGPMGVYLTGHFDDNITGVFGSAFNFPSGPFDFRTFVVSFSPGLNVNWAQEIQSATGTDITASGITQSPALNQVIVTGMITGNITSPTAMVPNGTYTSSSPWYQKVYIAAFDGSGTPLWSNTTTDNTPNSWHGSSRIVADGNVCYSTGAYINELNYNLTGPVPFSGPLMATPAGNRSSFFVRNDLAQTGAFFKRSPEVTVGSAKKVVPPTPGVMSIYPNPSEGTFTIDLGEMDTKGNRGIEIYDLLGKRVGQTDISPGQSVYHINLSDLPTGVYMIKMYGSGKLNVHKVVLQK